MHHRSERDGDRPLDVVGVEAVDQLVGPEPRVGAYGGRPGGPGASQVGDELVAKSHHSSRRARGAFAHAGGEHFAGVGACGQQRVIAQHLGVAVRGAALVLAVDPSQIVESRSTVSGLSPGPAPSPQARASVRASTASSWRAWPNVKVRKNDPTVEGAIGVNPSTRPVPPARSIST